MRSRAAGFVLRGFFFAVLALVVLICLYGLHEANIPGGSAEFALKLAIFVAAVALYPVYYIGRKLGAPSAIDVLTKDRRSPVLYLRGFSDDSDSFLRSWIQHPLAIAGFRKDEGVTVEEKLATRLKPVGPLVAIGRPGERLPTLGAARMYVDDEHWQEVVEQLIPESALIVLRLGSSRGLWWEIDLVLKACSPDRMLFYLLAGRPEENKQSYEGFRIRANTQLPVELPPSSDNAAYLGFDRDWRAIFHRSDPRLLFDARSPAVLVLTRTHGTPAASVRKDMEALAIVFDRVGPVVAVGPFGMQPPKTCHAWLHAEGDELARFLDQRMSRGSPVVMRADGNPEFVPLLSSVAKTVEPESLAILVPRLKGRRRSHQMQEVQRALATALPRMQNLDLRRAAYITFDGGWRPQVVRRGLVPPGVWLSIFSKKVRAAQRTGSYALTGIFERCGQKPPGRRARRACMVLNVLGVLGIGLASLPDTTDRNAQDIGWKLTANHNVNTNWQGLIWGLPADQVQVHFPHLDISELDLAATGRQCRSAGESVDVAGVSLIMALCFSSFQLTAAVLHTGVDVDGNFPIVKAALVGFYGPPEAQGNDVFEWTLPRTDVFLYIQEIDLEDTSKRMLKIEFLHVGSAADAS